MSDEVATRPRKRLKPPALLEVQGAVREELSAWFKAQIAALEEDHEQRILLLRTVGEHPSPIFQRQVVAHAARGIGKQQTAAMMGISVGILNAHYASDFARGIAAATEKVAESMFKIATDPNHPAAGKVGMDWLKRRGGAEWQEKNTLEIEDKRESNAPIIDSSKFTYEERQLMRAMIERIANGGEGEPLQPDEELPVIEG
jgi:hypothetical protein